LIRCSTKRFQEPQLERHLALGEDDIATIEGRV
jgi:hypothetical protein